MFCLKEKGCNSVSDEVRMKYLFIISDMLVSRFLFFPFFRKRTFFLYSEEMEMTSMFLESEGKGK